ncbi:MAG: inositol monophosphatase family protein [Candidatus Woesearchaeota archaeon]
MNSNYVQLRTESLDFFLREAPQMGAIALKYFGRLRKDQIHDKGGHIHDPVTVADTEISEYIVPLAKKMFGAHISLLTEESANDFSYDPSKALWIIDELDGSKNFKDNKEDFCILMAMAEPGSDGYEVTVGLVYKPVTKEFYFAIINHDAFYQKDDDKKILSVSNTNRIVSSSSVNANIGRDTFPQDHMDKFGKIVELMESFRADNQRQVAKNHRFTAGIEIMDVANGNVDLCLFAKAANWDYAAPSIILKQAGGEAYVVKSIEDLIKPRFWYLQMGKPGEYYPAIFTNGKIDITETLRQHITHK